MLCQVIHGLSLGHAQGFTVEFLVNACGETSLHFDQSTVCFGCFLYFPLFEVTTALCGPSCFQRSVCCGVVLGVELASLDKDVGWDDSIHQFNGCKLLLCCLVKRLQELLWWSWCHKFLFLSLVDCCFDLCNSFLHFSTCGNSVFFSFDHELVHSEVIVSTEVVINFGHLNRPKEIQSFIWDSALALLNLLLDQAHATKILFPGFDSDLFWDFYSVSTSSKSFSDFLIIIHEYFRYYWVFDVLCEG